MSVQIRRPRIIEARVRRDDETGPATIARSRPVAVEGPDRLDARTSRERAVDRLAEYWDREFLLAAKCPDESVTPARKVKLLGEILDAVGKESSVQRLIYTLFHDQRAAWVNNKNLEWLAMRRNRTFITPLLIKRRVGVEFRGARDSTSKITFKK